eukprot:1057824-Amphidinium_carterae.1
MDMYLLQRRRLAGEHADLSRSEIGTFCNFNSNYWVRLCGKVQQRANRAAWFCIVSFGVQNPNVVRCSTQNELLLNSHLGDQEGSGGNCKCELLCSTEAALCVYQGILEKIRKNNYDNFQNCQYRHLGGCRLKATCAFTQEALCVLEIHHGDAFLASNNNENFHCCVDARRAFVPFSEKVFLMGKAASAPAVKRLQRQICARMFGLVPGEEVLSL